MAFFFIQLLLANVASYEEELVVHRQELVVHRQELVVHRQELIVHRHIGNLSGCL